MSPALAAGLAMLATAYLMVGLGYSIVVSLIRLIFDEPVSAGGFLAQWLIWPWAVVASLRPDSKGDGRA